MRYFKGRLVSLEAALEGNGLRVKNMTVICKIAQVGGRAQAFPVTR
jgi:hypothetical protein